MTRDRIVASEWLSRFEGAGLDGVIVKFEHGTYEPGKRAMIKVKHVRTSDCVVAGFRWHQAGKNELVGSLLLGLYDDEGRLHHVGVTSSFTMARRKEIALQLAPLREGAMERHPWRQWAEASGGDMTRMPGGQSRWSAGKDLSWEPLPLRSARGHGALRTREGLRRGAPGSPTPLHSFSVSSGSSASCTGLSASGWRACHRSANR